MSRKVLQIGYEPERDRLTWDGWDIHCGQLLVHRTKVVIYPRSGYVHSIFIVFRFI